MNGKSYHNGKSGFEGEYLNGERHGKGKTYKYNDDLVFEGVYLNKNIEGIGKIYNLKGDLEFEFEYQEEKEMVKEKNIIIGTVN